MRQHHRSTTEAPTTESEDPEPRDVRLLTKALLATALCFGVCSLAGSAIAQKARAPGMSFRALTVQWLMPSLPSERRRAAANALRRRNNSRRNSRSGRTGPATLDRIPAADGPDAIVLESNVFVLSGQALDACLLRSRTLRTVRLDRTAYAGPPSKRPQKQVRTSEPLSAQALMGGWCLDPEDDGRCAMLMDQRKPPAPVPPPQERDPDEWTTAARASAGAGG